MSEDKKKPGVVFWATVTLVVVLVGYPLSFPPISLLYSKGYVPRWLDEPLNSFYAPCARMFLFGPEPLRGVYRGSRG